MTSLEPLSDLEGFEDEHRRWWPRKKTGAEAAAGFGNPEAMVEAADPEAATRRTDAGIMVNAARVAQGCRRARGDTLEESKP